MPDEPRDTPLGRPLGRPSKPLAAATRRDAFNAYSAMGTDRNVGLLAAHLNLPQPTIAKWCKEDDWEGQLSRDLPCSPILEVIDGERSRVLTALWKLYDQATVALDPKELTARDAARLMPQVLNAIRACLNDAQLASVRGMAKGPVTNNTLAILDGSKDGPASALMTMLCKDLATAGYTVPSGTNGK